MLAGTHWLAGRTNAIFAFLDKELFDDPVFQRMEGDDRQPAARSQGLHCPGQEGLQGLQFLIDRNAQGLKGACGRMDLAGFALDILFDDPGQLAGGGQRPGLENGFGDAAG